MEELGLWRLQGQGRWWLLERWGEVEVVRQLADILLPWRAGGPRRSADGCQASCTPSGPNGLGCGLREWVACWILRLCEERVVDQLDGEWGGKRGGASEVDFYKDCGPCSCPHPALYREQVWCRVAA